MFVVVVELVGVVEVVVGLWVSAGLDAQVGSPPLGWVWGTVCIVVGLFGLVVGVIVLTFVIGAGWWEGPCGDGAGLGL